MKKATYKRIMLKLSGEVLEGTQGSGIDFKMMQSLCKEVAALQKDGVEVVIVIGGGNFWRYRDFKDSGLDRVASDYMGMLATIMNSAAMQGTFTNMGVKARALSAIPMQNVVESYVRDKALRYLSSGEVVICSGGTGNPFFTTDTAAALRALELHCEVLMKATKVDYVYDKDPEKNKDAHKFEQMSYEDVLKRDLGVMDLSAISLCKEEKLPIIVFNLKTPDNMRRVLNGEKVGTLIN